MSCNPCGAQKRWGDFLDEVSYNLLTKYFITTAGLSWF